MPSRTVSLTGWGRISPSRAELAVPATVAGAARLLETSGRGVIPRGLGRSYWRLHTGLWEMLSFPFPRNQGTYYPILPSHIHNIHGGYEEFPPELGNESKYPYVRKY